jgi:hypothetical protein
MSFLSVLKSIGHGLLTGINDAQQFTPFISAIPAFGPAATTILNSVVAVEGLVTKSGTGAQKKAAATAIVNAVHPGIDPAALSATIDAVVAGLNALSRALSAAPVPA